MPVNSAKAADFSIIKVNHKTENKNKKQHSISAEIERLYEARFAPHFVIAGGRFELPVSGL